VDAETEQTTRMELKGNKLIIPNVTTTLFGKYKCHGMTKDGYQFLAYGKLLQMCK